MLTNNASFKYETLYNGTFEKMECRTNGTVTLQCCATKIRYIMCCIKPYLCGKNIENIIVETDVKTSHSNIPVILLYIYIKACNMVHNQIRIRILRYIHIPIYREVFQEISFSSN